MDNHSISGGNAATATYSPGNATWTDDGAETTAMNAWGNRSVGVGRFEASARLRSTTTPPDPPFTRGGTEPRSFAWLRSTITPREGSHLGKRKRDITSTTAGPGYAMPGAAPGCSSAVLSTAGKTLQVAWYVASSGQFT